MTTASARPAFDDALRHYAATLGFPSLSSYIIWCRKNGLGSSATKPKTSSQSSVNSPPTPCGRSHRTPAAATPRDAPTSSTGPSAAKSLRMKGIRSAVSSSRSSPRLKDYQRDEPFWETVMLFFANQPMLEPTYIGPIVDYIHYQKFVPQHCLAPTASSLKGRQLSPTSR